MEAWVMAMGSELALVGHLRKLEAEGWQPLPSPPIGHVDITVGRFTWRLQPHGTRLYWYTEGQRGDLCFRVNITNRLVQELQNKAGIERRLR